MTGRMRYLPKLVIDEIEDIKLENNINDNGWAMKELVKYSRVGREVEKLNDAVILKFHHNKKKQRSIL